MVTYPFSHGVDRKEPRGTHVVRRVAALELDPGTAKRRPLSTLRRPESAVTLRAGLRPRAGLAPQPGLARPVPEP